MFEWIEMEIAKNREEYGLVLRKLGFNKNRFIQAKNRG